MKEEATIKKRTQIPAAKIYFPDSDRKWIHEQLEECLQSGALTLGKHGRQLEKEFAESLGVPYAVAVNSGTSALEICLRVLEVQGKEVLVPTNTFFATAAAVLHAGAKLRFVDVNPETFAIDPESLKRSITAQTAGVILVHIGGLITHEISEIQKICNDRKLFLLEDAAHAHGSLLNGRAAGTFGLAGTFSFYPTKVMTSAEGGILVTQNKDLYEQALQYRDQGKEGFLTNYHVKLGYNWRLSEPHAIIGLSQFRRLKEFVSDRNRVAQIYEGLLTGMEQLRVVRPSATAYSNYYKFIALLDAGVDRKALKTELREKYQIGLSGEVYDTPCHRQPIFQQHVSDPDAFPFADDICARHICLPVYVGMTDEDCNRVVDALKTVLSRRSSR